VRIRLLHIVQNLNYGGMERVLSDLLQGLDPTEFEVHLLALQYLGRFAEGLDGRIPLTVAPPLGRLSMVWPRVLARSIARVNPDIVHTHSGVWYKAALAARLAGVRTILHTEHGRRLPDRWHDRIVDGLAAGYTRVVVAVSEELRIYLGRRVTHGRCRVVCIPNGVRTDVFAPRPDSGVLRRTLGLSPDVPIIGSVGRLEPVKGFDVMIAAMPHLLAGWDAGPAPVLVVTGDGSERPALEALARSLGVDRQVRLLGWHDRPSELLETSSVFSLSSRSEGTSISLLEAMSSGVCPVVTRVGGNEAVLGPGLAHRLVPPEDPIALAAGLRDALTEAAARTRDAAAGRTRVVENYGIGTVVRRHVDLYRETVAGQRR
jgi:glycosyltransferase involved in cell wall biosynthesis